MARKKQEEAPSGAPAWMATFSDLMNLLLCFFVLLFSMSTVDAEKFEQVIASFQSAFSILSGGGASILEGSLVSSGVSQLEMLDVYYKEKANSQSEEEAQEQQEFIETYKEQALEQSEEMAEVIEQAVERYGFQNEVEVNFDANYVMLNMNGALLFDSGKSEIKQEAYPLIDKIGKMLETYQDNIIEVEGHTDNVPIHSNRYEDNNVLSFYRARSVSDYLREITTINPAHIKCAGRGEYVPIADNSTPEGRARNRRVVIKIYNSYSSQLE